MFFDRRWNIKTLANQNQNLSQSNYRRRLYGEKEQPKVTCLDTTKKIKKILFRHQLFLFSIIYNYIGTFTSR